MSKGNKKRRRQRGLVLTREKCKATNRHGQPCKNWPMYGSVVCHAHGGRAPQVRRKAQERIMMAQDDAASVLVRFMASDKVPFAERRRCAEFLLTYEHRNEVTLTLAPWEQALTDILVDYDSSTVIDVEVIEPKRVIPPSDWEPSDEANFADDPPKYARGPRRRGQ